MTPALAADRVDRILEDCLFTEYESAEIASHDYTVEQVRKMNPPLFIVVEGIINNYAFHPGRLETYHAEVKRMLEELDDGFRQSAGGGMSSMNAVADKAGRLWGEQYNMERLCVLGIALGLARWTLPKEMWMALPGSMPFLTVLDKEEPWVTT